MHKSNVIKSILSSGVIIGTGGIIVISSMTSCKSSMSFEVSGLGIDAFNVMVFQ
jgi:hypothetical protein